MNSRKTLITFLNQLLVLAVNVMALKATLAALTPEDYGLYGYALSLTGLFMVFSELNLSNVFFKRIAEGHSIQEHYSTYVTIRLLLVGAAVGCFLCYAVVVNSPIIRDINKQTAVFGIMLLYYFFDAVLLAVMGAYQARREVRRTQTITAVMAIINLLFIVAFVMTTGNIWLFTVSLVVKPIVGIICFTRFMRGELNIFHLTLDRSITADYAGFVLPLLPMSILAVIYDKIDGTLVTKFLSFRANGYLTAATMFNTLLLIPSTAMMTLLYSSFAEELGKGDIHRVEEISRKATKYLSIFVSSCAMFFFFHAEVLVTIAMSREYLPAVPIIRVFMFQVVLMSVSRTFGAIIMSSERLRIISILGISLSILGIVLDFVFIPESLLGIPMMNLGAVGPAYKALVVYAVSIVSTALVLKKVMNITIYWRFLYHLGAAFIAGAAVIRIFPEVIGILGLVCSFVIFELFYILFLVLLREFRQDDVEYLLRSVAFWRDGSQGSSNV